VVYYSGYIIIVGPILGLYALIRKKQSVKTKPQKEAFIKLSKIQPEVYRGISFIRLSNLPRDQKQVISQTEIKRIKIKTESSILTDCVQYLDYEKWYESIRIDQHASVLGQSS